MNEKLQISIEGGKAYAHSLSQAVRTPSGVSEEYRYLYVPQVDSAVQERFKNTDSWFGNGFGDVVSLLHFSDLHGDAVNLDRIISFVDSLAFSPDVLFTGDLVKYDWADGVVFWSAREGAKKFMVTIGNHDTYKNGNWYGATASECYTRYIGANVSRWGVVSQQDVCYYYKDWPSLNVRLIVLDVMHWDATQLSWLTGLLASAKTAGYHIVIAGHCSPGVSDGGEKGCSFDTLGANRSYWEGQSYGKMDASVPAAVQDFIDAGGHFVCYLTGHTHADMFRHLTAYPDQLYVAVANASNVDNVGNVATCQLYRKNGEKSQDLFNLVTINPVRQLLTIVRVGADHDTIGRHIGTIVYDYANNEIIWND